MHILIITQHFPPEVEPSAQKIAEFGKMLTSLGHQVDIITGFPNYPTGIIPIQYKGKVLATEVIEGIIVHRTWMIPSSRKIDIRRFLSEFSFMVSAFVRGLFLAPPDYVLSTIPPLGPGLSALALSLLRKKPLVVEVRDPFADAAVEEGIIHNRLFLRLIKLVEATTCHGAVHIFTISEGLKEILIKNGVHPHKVSVVYSGTDLEMFAPVSITDLPEAVAPFQDKFVVMYSGTHGVGQKLETLIKAACILKAYDQIAFLLLGDGPDKEMLIKMTHRFHLRNVHFLDPVPRQDVARLMSVADVSVILLRDLPIHHCAIPSKTYDSMAMGKPIILSANAEAQRIVEKAQAGICVPPEDPERLAEGILYLYRNPTVCKAFGENGRLFAMENLSRQNSAEKFCQILAGLQPGSSSSSVYLKGQTC